MHASEQSTPQIGAVRENSSANASRAVGGTLWLPCQITVFDQQDAARLEHAAHFAQRGGGIGEVEQQVAAPDRVEGSPGSFGRSRALVSIWASLTSIPVTLPDGPVISASMRVTAPAAAEVGNPHARRETRLKQHAPAGSGHWGGVKDSPRASVRGGARPPPAAAPGRRSPPAWPAIARFPRESAEVAALDDFRFARVQAGQRGERVVQREQFLAPLHRRVYGLIQRSRPLAATPLGPPDAARMIDQHLPHQVRGHAEEMGAALPLGQFLRGEAEKCLVHEGGGL